MAFGASTFTNLGGAVSDIFGSFGSKKMAEGDRLAAGMYGRAAGISRQNETLQKFATGIEETQQAREAFKVIGKQIAGVAGAGFESSGSALDLLRSSSSQAAVANQLVATQGQIQMNTYEEQAIGYDAMQQAALTKAEAEDSAAAGQLIGGGLKGLAAVASFFI